MENIFLKVIKYFYVVPKKQATGKMEYRFMCKPKKPQKFRRQVYSGTRTAVKVASNCHDIRNEDERFYVVIIVDDMFFTMEMLAHEYGISLIQSLGKLVVILRKNGDQEMCNFGKNHIYLCIFRY